MKNKILVAMLALSLGFAMSGNAAAGILGYDMEGGERGFKESPPSEPSASVVAADALIARPIGLGVTLAGTAVFVVILPFSISSGSTREAAQGLIVKPGGYTFVRPLGRDDPRFEEPTLFEP